MRGIGSKRRFGFGPERCLRVVLVLTGCWVGWSGSSAVRAGEGRAGTAPFELKGGERIVFFGDSITQAGGYVADVEVFLLTRFPDKTWTILNHGISSETISGISEADHHPRRPDAHNRLTRDVVAWKPDVVVACFGMNDGNYHPFEPERFAKYQDGIRRLIERTRAEAHARLVLLSPPPFDPYRRTASDPSAVEYGYKFPALDYESIRVLAFSRRKSLTSKQLL
jgi:lysophospholipase L1-like esterase